MQAHKHAHMLGSRASQRSCGQVRCRLLETDFRVSAVRPSEIGSQLGLIKWSLCPLRPTAKFCTIFWQQNSFLLIKCFYGEIIKYKETKAFISSLSASSASSSCEIKQVPATGWRRWGYGTRIQGDKKWVLFCICSQTRGLSDFSHIVAALINVPPLAQQTLSCYKCAFSMQGMCAGAPPLPV